jgi:flagellar motor component MotA
MAICRELALMDYFLEIIQKARRDGLLALEEAIHDIEKQDDFEFFDLIYVGLRLVVDGWDCESIEKIFSNYRKQTLDEITFNIITESCLAIQRGDSCIQLIFYYASLLSIKMRKSEYFISLAERYGYRLKYELLVDYEDRRRNESRIF